MIEKIKNFFAELRSTISRWIALYAVVLTVVVFVTISSSIKKAQDVTRLESNQAVLLSENDTYRTKNGELVSGVAALQMECNTWKTLCHEQSKKVYEMGIKIKRLESFSQNVVVTTVDTVVKVETEQLPQRPISIAWKDNWVDLRVAVSTDIADVHVESVDTLIQVVHRVPHQWLFFRYGTKGIRQEILSTNPHTRIVYSEYIKFIK